MQRGETVVWLDHHMGTFALWAGAVGAWFLVAGPLFQGSLELWEVARSGPAWPDRRRVDRALWLLPAVLYVVQRSRLQRLSASGDELSASFANRATGWFAVAAGASLVALKETWDLAEHFDLAVTTYWAVVVLALMLAQANVTVRMLRLTRETRPIVQQRLD
jgi:hypothetical protein